MGNKYVKPSRYKYISENGLEMISSQYCTALGTLMIVSLT